MEQRAAEEQSRVSEDRHSGASDEKPRATHAPTGVDEAMAKPMGAVYYLDGESLNRPIELPRPIKLKIIIFVVIAIAIGGAVLYAYFDGVVNAPQRELAAVEESLAQPQALDIPVLSTLVSLSDGDIMAALSATGDTLFEKTPAGAGPTFEVIKLPQGVSLADAGAMYLTGIEKLSPSQAIILLNGSWDLDVNREKGLNMSLHYADLTAGSVENAVQAALQAQGLDSASITDSGVDSSGNVYSSGNLEVGDITYVWKVSSVPLADIYDIAGVPENAAYVGIRFTA